MHARVRVHGARLHIRKDTSGRHGSRRWRARAPTLAAGACESRAERQWPARASGVFRQIPCVVRASFIVHLFVA